MINIERLQFITGDINSHTHSEQAEMACKGGIKWIQLRMKTATCNHFLEEALKIREITNYYRSRLIINDNPNIAQLSGADGVHLGKRDMSPAEARELLGPDRIIGLTINGPEDVTNIPSKELINYFGVGPFRFTKTKENLSPILGESGLKNIMRLLSENNIKLPVIAVGGIKLDDIPNIVSTGVSGIAVSSAISSGKDILHSAKRWMEQTDLYFKK